MLNIIAAVSQNGVIGAKGKLPFSLPLDMTRFKSLTLGNVVIMGKNTYLSIGRPLPDRINVVVSKTLGIVQGAYVVDSFENALALAARIAPDKEVFVIGGQRLYAQSLAAADRLYVTRVHLMPQGDAYFPKIPDTFRLQSSERVVDNGIITDFCVYLAAR